MKSPSNIRRFVEALLIAPATATYGLAALVGLPMGLIGFAVGGNDFPPESRLVLGVLVALGIGAIVGLTALWLAIVSEKFSTAVWTLIGIAVGIATAGLSIWVTFSNDDFEWAVTMSNNSYLLMPLFAVGLVAVGRLVTGLRLRLAAG